MLSANVHEAKTHLSRLLKAVADGQEVVISRAGTPIARLVPFESDADKPRELGFVTGDYWEAPDCWEPDETIVKLFCDDQPSMDDLSGRRVAEDAPPS